MVPLASQPGRRFLQQTRIIKTIPLAILGLLLAACITVPAAEKALLDFPERHGRS